MVDDSAPDVMGGARRPTIKDVAREAGVSFKTVSRVVNGEGRVNSDMRAAVEKAMASLGYRPHLAARTMRTNRTYAITVLGGSREPTSPENRSRFPQYLGEVITGCSQACQPAGYHLVLEFLTYGDKAGAMSVANALLDNLRPDGVVLTPPVCDLDWLLDILEARGTAYVRLMPGRDLDRGACLNVDDFAAAHALTERLLDAGHTHLAMIAGPTDHFAASKRREGFEAAVNARQGATMALDEGDFFANSGEVAARKLLQSDPRPSAIFAGNDAMAVGVLRAAATMGIRVPTDLAIAGFDDSSIAALTTPRLTSVRQPTYDLAHRAAEMLIAAANEGRAPTPGQLRLECTIVERESTGPAEQ